MTDITNDKNKFLSEREEVSKYLEKANVDIRFALSVAGRVASVDVIMQIAIAIKTIDRAWELNQEQIEILKQEEQRT